MVLVRRGISAIMRRLSVGISNGSGIEMGVFGEEVDNLIDEIVEEFGEFGLFLDMDQLNILPPF